jgi:hypothetical protein
MMFHSVTSLEAIRTNLMAYGGKDFKTTHQLRIWIENDVGIAPCANLTENLENFSVNTITTQMSEREDNEFIRGFLVTCACQLME